MVARREQVGVLAPARPHRMPVQRQRRRHDHEHGEPVVCRLHDQHAGPGWPWLRWQPDRFAPWTLRVLHGHRRAERSPATMDLRHRELLPGPRGTLSDVRGDTGWETVPVSVYFSVLGPLRVVRDGRDVPIPAAKERGLLAALLLDANRWLTTERLIDHLWGDDPIPSARQTLIVYVHRLRGALGRDRIPGADHGYRIKVGPGELDLADFESLTERADEAERRGELSFASDLLHEALGLWRGEPLTDVSSESLHSEVVQPLTQRRLAVTERRYELELALGRSRDTAVELRRIVAEHPLRERLWGLLIRALYASGRRAEALAAYREVAAHLAGELGIDPGAELQELHQSVLTGTLATAEAPAQGTETPVVTPPVVSPRQLPAAPAGFVGRQTSVDRLLSWFGADAEAPTVHLHGPPGVGKSALAVHIGHLLVDRFPDGQLFVDLRGFSAEQALRPADVLPRFLRTLGVPAEQVPADVDEQAAMFRSRLAGRRVLVVLDNAATPEQVRPLLPGEPGCGVIVTSRNQLRPLVALDGAKPFPLDVLTEQEATALLADRVDAARVSAEPEALARIAESCGRLPLALRVAGANLALRPHERVADYATELDKGGRLLRLWAGDDRSAVQAAFHLSYTALDPDARRLFRQLGLIPGADFTTEAAAALTGGTDVRRPLDTLVAASLLQQQAVDRYRLHDLVRDYASQRVLDEDGRAAAAGARQQLFDWYVRKTDAALLPQTAAHYRLPRPQPDDALVARTGVEWIDVELANLSATVAHCAEHGPHLVVWHLTDALRPHFAASGNGSEYAGMTAVALSLAEREGDPLITAAMSLAAGMLRSNLAHAEEQRVALIRAAGLFTEVAELHGAASALRRLCIVDANASRHADALLAGERALALFRRIGNGPGVSAVTQNLALLKTESGRLTAAVDDLESLLANDDATDPESRARIHGIIGHALRRVGRLADARTHLVRAIELYDEARLRGGATVARCDLARTLCDAGEHDRARPFALEAIAAAERLDDRENTIEARAVVAEIDVRGRPPTQWDEALAPTAEEMEPIADHPLYFRWLDVLGWAHVFAGNHDKALEVATHTLAAARERSLRLAEDAALTVLTAALVGLGRFDEAIEHGTEALRRHRETGYRLREARSLCYLGDARHATGDTVAAREDWQQARDVYTAIGSAEVTEAARRLGE
ncbi:MAG: tetratricopeptide repeat protein [Streptosporangiales bacterium]|nr:tetratricopeptide repeat protein [Streptosporangiales bacterium]